MKSKIPLKKKTTKKSLSKDSTAKLDVKNLSAGGTRSLRFGLRRSLFLIRSFRRQIGFLTLIYGGLYFLLVRAITKLNLPELRETVALLFGGGEETFSSRAILAGSLFGESTNFDQASGFYFVTIFTLCSLAFIWLLRHMWANKRTTLKEAFYQGMYPLIPVLLVFLLMLLQSVPFSIGSYIMQVSFSNGIAISLIEKLGIMTIFVAGTALSAYWIVGSIVALYAVTVPGMTPLNSLRRAKQLLRGRRLAIVRQLLGFIIITGLACMAAMLLVIYFVPDASIVAVTILIVLLMPWMHLYLYGLYRDLLHEA